MRHTRQICCSGPLPFPPRMGAGNESRTPERRTATISWARWPAQPRWIHCRPNCECGRSPRFFPVPAVATLKGGRSHAGNNGYFVRPAGRSQNPLFSPLNVSRPDSQEQPQPSLGNRNGLAAAENELDTRIFRRNRQRMRPRKIETSKSRARALRDLAMVGLVAPIRRLIGTRHNFH